MPEEIKNETNAENSQTNEPASKPEPTVQDLMNEIAKLKRGLDKASSEAADYKNKWKSSMTEQEKASQEKAEREAEREERYNALLRENGINKFAKNFMALGYSEAQAEQAATAQYDGDTDSLFKIQSEVQTGLLKAKEAEMLKNRPPVSAGVGDGAGEDPFLKGFLGK